MAINNIIDNDNQGERKEEGMQRISAVLVLAVLVAFAAPVMAKDYQPQQPQQAQEYRTAAYETNHSNYIIKR